MSSILSDVLNTATELKDSDGKPAGTLAFLSPGATLLLYMTLKKAKAYAALRDDLEESLDMFFGAHGK